MDRRRSSRRTTRGSESPQSKRRRARDKKKVEAKAQAVLCALSEAKLYTDGDGASPTRLDLCGTVAQRVPKDTNKGWDTFKHNYTTVHERLLVDGVHITMPLISGITQFCNNCYRKIMRSGNNGGAVLNAFIGRLKDRIPKTVITCCVHGISLDECGSNPRFMMKRGDDLAIAEQKCFIKTLFGVDVCGNKKKLNIEELCD